LFLVTASGFKPETF